MEKKCWWSDLDWFPTSDWRFLLLLLGLEGTLDALEASSFEMVVQMSIEVDMSSGGTENLPTSWMRSFFKDAICSSGRRETEAKRTRRTWRRVYRPTPSGVWMLLLKYSCKKYPRLLAYCRNLATLYQAADLDLATSNGFTSLGI